MADKPRESVSDEHNYDDYFDIMLLGKTGMGKTTTADKIIIANLVELPGSKPVQEVTINTTPSSTQCTDVAMWYLSDEPDEMERVSQRLKNLILWRSMEDPHKEINQKRTEESRNTDKCELLCNDTSKVRVLDVPGFHGSNESCSFSMYDNDLCIVRKIFHIKTAHKFKFNRIVYFLPETGVLIRDSQILHMEMKLMQKYFGRSIFESMVVAATHNHNAYRNYSKTVDMYSSADIKTTSQYFEKALKKVVDVDGLSVPLTFLSLFDTCERVLQKIKDTRVVREGAGLDFNPSTCARCGGHIGNDGEETVPNTCHPMIIPKHTKVQRVVDQTVHLVTFRIFLEKWPSFGYLDEKCIKCGEPPSSTGCSPVGTGYTHQASSDEIPVAHTSEVLENYSIDIDDEQHFLEMDGMGEEQDLPEAEAPRVSRRKASNTQLAEVYLRKCKEQENL